MKMSILGFIDQSMHHQDVLSCNPLRHSSLLWLILVDIIFLYARSSYRVCLPCLTAIGYFSGPVFSFMGTFLGSNHTDSRHLPNESFN